MARSVCRSERISSKPSTAILLGLLVVGSAINAADAAIVYGFVFGDSTSDVGTNNFLTNPATPKANFPPYGETFYRFPTGRFCNGRLAGDFIAMDLSLPSPLPYLTFHGSDFASGGSGILDDTNSYQGIINLSTQISQFQSMIAGLKSLPGPISSGLILNESLFSFSTGNNDLFVYFANTTLQATVPLPQYLRTMVDTLIAAIQKTIDTGARKLLVNGLGPIGCTPQLKAGVAAATPSSPTTSPCSGTANQAAKDFNSLLVPRLAAIGAANNATVLYANIYNILNNVIVNYQSLGFVQNSVACCGSGSFNAVTQCGVGTYNLCPDPSQYVFWDFVHPTEATYKIIADKLFTGNTTSISPINIQQLSQLP